MVLTLKKLKKKDFPEHTKMFLKVLSYSGTPFKRAPIQRLPL